VIPGRLANFSYNAASGVLARQNHIYTDDAEQRINAVDGGSLSTHVYDAEEFATVIHFTRDARMQAITESGALIAGTFIASAREIPGGAAAGQVESLLDISPGNGANSITFDTPTPNLTTASNGPTTGGAAQFQLKNPPPVNPASFRPTPKTPPDQL
jgi:hypothetical protein